MKRFFSRTVHSSWMIAAVSASLFLGVVLAPILNLYFIALLPWVLIGITLSVVAIIKQKVVWIFLVVIGGLIIGLCRGTTTRAALDAYQPLIGHTITFSGIVGDDTDKDKQGNTTVRLRDIKWRGHNLPGMVWVSLSKNTGIERSDRVTITGQLTEGFGTFAASSYRAKLESVVRPQPGDVALHVRDWFSNAVRQAIPEPESSLGVGYLVGQRRSLPDTLDTALKTAGLTHIVVASGYNLTILVRLARRLFEKISKYLSALVSGSLIIGFIAVTGLSPSMSRAGLITGLSLLAWYYGRRVHPLVLLPFAVAVTVLFNPSYAWGDVGWELSFAAFAGVMVLAPLLQRFYFGETKPGTVRQILGETISAWLCTLPILLYSFGYMSNVAIIANLMILPLIPLAMLLTFTAGLGALVIPIWVLVIGYPAYLLLHYMTQTTLFFANLSWAKSDVILTGWHVVLIYATIISFATYMWWCTRLNLGKTNIVE